MTTPGSKILVWLEPPRAYVRLVGRAAVEGARDFKALMLRLDQQGIRQFCLDLSDCKIMDSTFSGVLAALATDLAANEAGGAQITVVRPNERVRDLLDNLGVLPLLNVIDAEGHLHRPSESTTALEVATGTASRREVAECCLEAHQVLSALNEANRMRFADVTQVLERQIAAAQ